MSFTITEYSDLHARRCLGIIAKVEWNSLASLWYGSVLVPLSGDDYWSAGYIPGRASHVDALADVQRVIADALDTRPVAALLGAFALPQAGEAA